MTLFTGNITDVLLGYGTAIYRYPPASSNVDSANMIINPSFEFAANVGSADGLTKKKEKRRRTRRRRRRRRRRRGGEQEEEQEEEEGRQTDRQTDRFS